jgi:hypothetical protein
MRTSWLYIIIILSAGESVNNSLSVVRCRHFTKKKAFVSKISLKSVFCISSVFAVNDWIASTRTGAPSTVSQSHSRYYVYMELLIKFISMKVIN